MQVAAFLALWGALEIDDPAPGPVWSGKRWSGDGAGRSAAGAGGGPAPHAGA